MPCDEIRPEGEEGARLTYKHAGVRDEGIVSVSKLSKRLQEPRSECITETEGVEGGREGCLGPELGDISLWGLPEESISILTPRSEREGRTNM